ncbi:MAG TPA: alpha-hydroxy acid oxidase [Solirubrobacterales bacterium]|nr:alpha-hydroxy acid oxidase [Solirubrobacterales bacterium]
MPRSAVKRLLTIEDVRARARRRLPRAIFDAIDGAAEDELTMAENRAAFRRIRLRPRAVADVSRRDLSTTVLGQPVSMPLLLGPCGMARMADSGAEPAAARAAAAAGTIFVVAGTSAYTPAQIAAVAPSSSLWYQLYLPPDREAAARLVDSVRDADYPVLCVTIDSAVSARRERDYRNGLTIPLKISPKLLATGISHPRWTRDFLFGKVGRGEGFGFYQSWSGYQKLATTISDFMPVTMADVHWLRERWPRKLVVKGIQRGDEVGELIEAGVDGFVVSNHGGRNLDGVRGSIEVLPEVVAAAGGRAEVLVDGGVRRGADALKAVALGARACLVGRPYMFGLGAAGEAGVEHVLQIFASEMDGAAAMLGCARVDELDGSFVDVEAG